ncbi:MAG TPA: HDOD domain-containing protein, partial [Gammaproteobacteria bacterium]|nr:HDOD domain-containing protein [Gammaproteobacteria bacterium]
MAGAVRDTTETRIEVLKLNELPAVPAVAHQFIQAVEDPDIEVRQLAAIIERDPALTARIIGLANAAYFGVSEEVTSVEHAIFKVLGINTAKSLALSIVLSGPLQAGRCPGFDLERYWSSAVLAATAAQRL